MAAPRIRAEPRQPSAGEELVVRVVTGSAASLDLDDGTVLRLTADALTVEGSERDVLVVADGRPVSRARGASLRFDLQAAADLRALRQEASGRSPGWHAERLAAEQERDATTGLRHHYDVIPDPPPPGRPATVWVDSDVPLRGGSVSYTVDGSEPTTGTSDTAPLRPSGGRWAATIPGQPAGTRVRYRIEARMVDDAAAHPMADAASGFVYPAVHVPFVRPPRDLFSYVVGSPSPPDWARDAVIYHALVDRFADDSGGEVPGDGLTLLAFAGGTIRGLIRRLDHVAELGCTVLWVSPLHAGETHVCYDVRDHFAVEPRLGTLDDARALCAEAHRRGLRVLLDLQMSYLGARHPVAEAVGRHRDHPRAGWFLWATDPVRRFGWLGGNPSFAAVDHSDAEARAHLLDAARFWLELGFDGFRFDSAAAAPFDFWSEVGQIVRTERPEAFTVAEAPGPLAQCVRYHGRLDGFLDFELSAALRNLVATGDLAPSAFDRVVAERDGLPPGLLAPAFVESHDGDRFWFLAGGDERRLRLALLLLMALPGPPVLYYGTEVGLDQQAGGDCDLVARAPMPWSRLDDDRLAWVRRAVAARHRSRPLRRGGRRTLLVDDERSVYAFARSLDGEHVVATANLGLVRRVLTVPVGDLWPDGSRLAAFPEGPDLAVEGGTVTIDLDALDGVLLAPPPVRDPVKGRDGG